MTATWATKSKQKQKKAKAKTKKALAKKKAKKKAATKKAKARTRTARSSGDRFEARRAAAARSRGRRRLRLVLGLALVSTLAIAMIGFLNSSLFDVDTIEVRGADRADPELILAASGIELGQALLEVDLDGAVEEVQLVPWVGSATVKRSWTGTIEIAVVERGPSAALESRDGFALVDDHGRQLETVDTRPPGFMPIRGIEGSGVAGEPAPPEVLPVIALLDALPPEIESQVSGVVIEEGELFLELAVGGRANFGNGSELGPKLQALETMLARVDLRCLDTIDVTVPAAPVLTRTGQLVTESGVEGANPGPEGAGSEDGEEPDSAGSGC